MREESPSAKRRRNTWVWIVLAVVLSLLVVGFAIAGGFAYYIFRQTSIETTSSSTAADRFEQVRSRFKDRTPYIELDSDGDMKIHSELEGPTEAELKALHILAFDVDDSRLIESSIPFWFVRLKTSGPFKIQLDGRHRDLEVSAENLARRGPGIVVDFEEPGGGSRVLVWAE